MALLREFEGFAMSVTRFVASGSLAALIAGALPPAAWAAGSTVLPKLAAPAAATASETPPPLPAEVEAGAVWYVVIDGAKVGPLTDEALIRRMQKGEITSASLVWRSGMDGWRTIAESETLMAKHVAAAIRNQKPKTPLDEKFGVI
ncbi:MAG: DUF4339 domain-containing protein [Micropepsaceae bacterium]